MQIAIGLNLSGGVRTNHVRASLFADGSNGAWFDYAELDRLFVDSTGVTNVSASGNAVGLALDKHDAVWAGKTLTQVAALQPELLTNTDFATDTVWTTGAGWSNSGGVATHVGPTSGGLDQAEAMTAGSIYRVQTTVTGRTSSSIAPQLLGGATVSGASYVANGTLLQHLLGTASHTTLRFLAGGTFDGSLDNASLKAIPGNAALQATGASQPSWISGGKIRGDGTADNLLMTLLPQSGENCIVAAVTVPLTIAATQIICGTAAASDGRLWLGVNVDGKACAGIGAHTETTIVGTSDLRGSTVVIAVSIDGSTVKLFVDNAEEYSGAQSGNPNTTVPFRQLALNNNGTAASFFAGDLEELVIGRKALTLSQFSSISRQILPEPTVLTGWVLALSTQTGVVPDYIVDPTTGSDSNPGTINAPWETLEPLRDAVAALPNNGSLKGFIKGATYSQQHLDMWNTNAPVDVLLACEAGAIIEWLDNTQFTRDVGQNGLQFGDNPASSFEMYGNGLIIRGFNTGTGNGVGVYGADIIVRDVVVTDCVDGVTSHSEGTITVYDSDFSDCNKAASDNVGSGGIIAYRCNFTGKTGASQGILRFNDTTTGYFEDCNIVPAFNGQTMIPKDCEFVDGTIGTVSLTVNVATGTPGFVVGGGTVANITYV